MISETWTDEASGRKVYLDLPSDVEPVIYDVSDWPQGLEERLVDALIDERIPHLRSYREIRVGRDDEERVDGVDQRQEDSGRRPRQGPEDDREQDLKPEANARFELEVPLDGGIAESEGQRVERRSGDRRGQQTGPPHRGGS